MKKAKWPTLDKAFLALYSNIATSNIERLYNTKDKTNFVLLKNLVNYLSPLLRSKTFQKKLNENDLNIYDYFNSSTLNKNTNENKFEIKEEVFPRLLNCKNINSKNKQIKISEISDVSDIVKYLNLIRNYYSHKENYNNNDKKLFDFQKCDKNSKFLKDIFKIYFDLKEDKLSDELFHLIYCSIFLTPFEMKNLKSQIHWNINYNDKIEQKEKEIIKNWNNFFKKHHIFLSRIRFSFKNPTNNIDFEEKAFAILCLINKSLESKSISRKIIGQYTAKILNEVFKNYQKDKAVKINVNSSSIFHKDLENEQEILNPWYINKQGLENYDISNENIVANFQRNYIKFKISKDKKTSNLLINYNSLVRLTYYLKNNFKEKIIELFKDFEIYNDFQSKSEKDKTIEYKENLNRKFNIFEFSKQKELIKKEKTIEYKSFINMFRPEYISKKNNNLRRCLKIINKLYFLKFERFLTEDEHLCFKNSVIKESKKEILENLRKWKDQWSCENSFLDTLIKQFKTSNLEVFEILNNFVLKHFNTQEKYEEFQNNIRQKNKPLINNKNNFFKEIINDFFNHPKRNIILEVKENLGKKVKNESFEIKDNFELKKSNKIIRKCLPLLNIFYVYKENFKVPTINLKKINWKEEKIYPSISNNKSIENKILRYMGENVYIKKQIALKEVLKKTNDAKSKINEILSNSQIYNSQIYENYLNLTNDFSFKEDEDQNPFKILNVYIKKRELYFVRKYLYIDVEKDSKEQQYFRNKIFHRLSHKKEENKSWRHHFVKKHLIFTKYKK